MLTTILSISGKAGLFRLISQGKNTLIVESLVDGKRFPAHAKDHVISLRNISMFTYSEDIPLSKVLTLVYEKNEGKPVDVKALKDKEALFSSFETILEDFDQERVYPNDIKKLYTWYNTLLKAGFTDFSDQEEEEEA